MINHEYIESNQVIDRYIMGTLSDSESEEFGEHFIGCERCLNQLELAEGFQRELKKTFAHRVIQTGLIFKLTRHWAYQTAMAAILILMSGAAIYFYRGSMKPPTPALGGVTDFVSFRSATETDFKIAFGSETPWAVFNLADLEVDPNTVRIQWRILDDEEKILFAGERPGGDGRVALSLHRGNLKPGIYTLEIKSILQGGAAEEPRRFSFEVVQEQ